MLKVKYYFDESNIHFTFAVSLIKNGTKDNTKAVGSTEPTINISIAKLADCLVFFKF